MLPGASTVSQEPCQNAAVAPTYALTIHRDYACRSSGACCTSGWPIPAERDTVGAVTSAIARNTFSVRGEAGADQATGPGTLRPDPLFTGHAVADGDVVRTLATAQDGSCVFFERDHGRLCAIHRQLGHAALPSACRQFPRVTLTDARGNFVSLSHYCPTAARLLCRNDAQLAIERDPPAFCGARCEGLDARDTLPPLLRPGMLHSLDSYTAWEQFQVGVFADEHRSAESALATIADGAERARGWTPALGTLEGHLARTFAEAVARPAGDVPGAPVCDALALAQDVWASYPAPLRGPGPVHDFEASWARLAAAAWPDLARPVRHYLAARAFGSWVAYQGAGIRTAVHALRTALALLQVECVRQCQARQRSLDQGILVEAVRAADLALVHLAAPDLLTRRLARLETVPASTPRVRGQV